jgi:hypothetical protein
MAETALGIHYIKVPEGVKQSAIPNHLTKSTCLTLDVSPTMSIASSTETGMDVPMSTFLWGHIFASFVAPKVNLEGRTVLVTGGNAG